MFEMEWFTTSNMVILCIGLGTLLYIFHSRFAFIFRKISLDLYIAIMSILIIPFMIPNGRNVKNVMWCSRAMIPGRWLFGLTGEVLHREYMPKDKPCVIVSNHQSTLDLFGIADLSSINTTYLAKKELLYYGHLGLCFWLSGAVFIDRKAKGGKSAMEKCAKEVLERNLKIWIFPEGTRYSKGGMLPFKLGAFNLAVTAQIPIVPVVYKSFSNFYNPHKNLFKSGKYTIEVMPPISTEGMSEKDVPQLSRRVRSQMLLTYNRLSNAQAEN